MSWYKKHKVAENYWTKSQVFVDNGISYDIDLLQKECGELKVVDFPISKLVKQLKENVWSQGDNKLSPIEVLKNKEEHKDDYDIIARCSLEDPILIRESDSMIIDGYHRLCKALLEKSKSIKAKLVSEELLEKSKVDNFV